MIRVRQKLFLTKVQRGQQKIRKEKPVAKMVEAGRVPRISRLMALAIRFEGMLRNGEVSDQSELARLANVTQSRMTQILNLLHLAPSIQEELLFLSRLKSGMAPIHEKMLRPIAAEVDWARQGKMWELLERTFGLAN
jgi:hypothetical protein